MPLYEVWSPDNENEPLGEVYIKPRPPDEELLRDADAPYGYNTHELFRYETKIGEALAHGEYIPHGWNPGFHFFVQFFSPNGPVSRLPTDGTPIWILRDEHPFLILHPQVIHPRPRDFFYSFELIPQGSYTLIGSLSYISERQRIRIDVVSLRREKLLDVFEWPLDQWLDRPTFGFDPVNGELLPGPNERKLKEILVALDAEMEKN